MRHDLTFVMDTIPPHATESAQWYRFHGISGKANISLPDQTLPYHIFVRTKFTASIKEGHLTFLGGIVDIRIIACWVWCPLSAWQCCTSYLPEGWNGYTCRSCKSGLSCSSSSADLWLKATSQSVKAGKRTTWLGGPLCSSGQRTQCPFFFQVSFIIFYLWTYWMSMNVLCISIDQVFVHRDSTQGTASTDFNGFQRISTAQAKRVGLGGLHWAEPDHAAKRWSQLRTSCGWILLNSHSPGLCEFGETMRNKDADVFLQLNQVKLSETPEILVLRPSGFCSATAEETVNSFCQHAQCCCHFGVSRNGLWVISLSIIINDYQWLSMILNWSFFNFWSTLSPNSEPLCDLSGLESGLIFQGRHPCGVGVPFSVGQVLSAREWWFGSRQRIRILQDRSIWKFTETQQETCFRTLTVPNLMKSLVMVGLFSTCRLGFTLGAFGALCFL